MNSAADDKLTKIFLRRGTRNVLAPIEVYSKTAKYVFLQREAFIKTCAISYLESKESIKIHCQLSIPFCPLNQTIVNKETGYMYP